MNAPKLLALGGLLAAGLTFNGTAGADVSGNLSDLLVAGTSVSDQDKIWANFSSSLSGTQHFDILTIPAGTQDLHTFSLQINASGLVNQFVQYTIEVNPAALLLDPNLKIVSVDLGSTRTGGGTTSAMKYVWTDGFDGPLLTGAPLNSPNGIDPPGITASHTKLWIRDVLNTTGGGVINNITNTYTEDTSRVPVPGTLALFGLGLAGLSRIRGRKA